MLRLAYHSRRIRCIIPMQNPSSLTQFGLDGFQRISRKLKLHQRLTTIQSTQNNSVVMLLVKAETKGEGVINLKSLASILMFLRDFNVSQKLWPLQCLCLFGVDETTFRGVRVEFGAWEKVYENFWLNCDLEFEFCTFRDTEGEP